MYRRQILLSLIAIAASQTACQRNLGPVLRIAGLKGALPPRLIGSFEASQADSFRLQVNTQEDIGQLFQKLRQWQAPAPTASGPQIPLINRSRTSAIANWLSLGDYWLTAAIQQQLIQPIAVDTISAWSDLSPVWQSLLKRSQNGLLAPTGQVWGTPYRWGNLVIVYAPSRFEQLKLDPPRRWADLWEEPWQTQLAGRISLPNHPRIVLGIVLKSLGLSVNTPRPSEQSEVVATLAKVQRLVRAYMSTNYLQSLLQEDIWLAVGWSTDMRPILAQQKQLKAIVPEPGTLLSADLWVSPQVPLPDAADATGSNDSASPATNERRPGQGSLYQPTQLDQDWLSYWWNPDVTTPLSLFSDGLAPRLINTDIAADDLQKLDLASEGLLIPTQSQLANSEFIEPLPNIADTYGELWEQLRRSE